MTTPFCLFCRAVSRRSALLAAAALFIPHLLGTAPYRAGSPATLSSLAPPQFLFPRNIQRAPHGSDCSLLSLLGAPVPEPATPSCTPPRLNTTPAPLFAFLSASYVISYRLLITSHQRSPTLQPQRPQQVVSGPVQSSPELAIFASASPGPRSEMTCTCTRIQSCPNRDDVQIHTVPACPVVLLAKVHLKLLPLLQFPSFPPRRLGASLKQ